MLGPALAAGARLAAHRPVSSAKSRVYTGGDLRKRRHRRCSSCACSWSIALSTARPARAPAFTESDLETARICQLLARFGVEPRNLRLLGSSVEREAALVEQITTPSSALHSRRQARIRREDGGRPGSSLSQLMHLLLYKELRKLL